MSASNLYPSMRERSLELLDALGITAESFGGRASFDARVQHALDGLAGMRKRYNHYETAPDEQTLEQRAAAATDELSDIRSALWQYGYALKNRDGSERSIVNTIHALGSQKEQWELSVKTLQAENAAQAERVDALEHLERAMRAIAPSSALVRQDDDDAPTLRAILRSVRRYLTRR